MLGKLTHCIAEQEQCRSWTWVKCRVCAYIIASVGVMTVVAIPLLLCND
jgi:hypothetical protein